MRVALGDPASRWALYAAAGSAALLAPLALAADRTAGLRPAQVTVDVGLGLALAISGLLGRPPRQGALVALVGTAWLLGSLLPQAVTLSRGLLLLALVAFPAGLVRDRWGWWPYGAAALVAFPGCPQVVVGLVFISAAVVLNRTRAAHSPRPLPAGLALVAGLLQLFGAFAAASGFNELLAVSRQGYALVLLGVALGFPWASRRAPRQLVDGVAALTTRQPSDPWERLAQLLGATLGDRQLRVSPGSQRPEHDGLSTQHGNTRELQILNGSTPIAVVTSSSAALDDMQTARAVGDAVRLMVQHTDLVAQERHRARELAASQARLVTAEDLERAALGATLRDHVSSPIEAVARDLRSARAGLGDPLVSEAVEVALQDLDSAVAETQLMTAGLPPSELGDGRLAEALEDLARRSPLPMVTSVHPSARGDQAAETVIYAACAEALTNTLKHAGAMTFSCRVALEGEDLVAVLADDGRGGANRFGRGLQGLADRISARGGTLQIVPGSDSGTVLVARVPRRAS